MSDKIITIKNDTLKVDISTLGAELQSVKLRGEERLWQGDPAIWSGRSPILFPVCGSLKGWKYTYEGKEYSIKQHGFARRKTFEVESVTDNQATFSLKSDEETKAVYPFDFVLFVTYTLDGDSIKVRYEVKNEGKKMWAFIGSHEAYAIELPLSSYDLLFEKEERLLSRIVIDGGLVCSEFDDFGSGRILPISEQLFKHNTAVFIGIKSRSVTLRKEGKPITSVTFDAENLLIWTMPGASYVCIEPWTNYPDEETADGDILHKPGITLIDEGKSFVNEHVIKFF